jgi:predicted nucleotidyltransferase
MRNTTALDALFSPMRAALLAALLLEPAKWWFMTEIAKRLGRTPSSLQRELESLVASGILLRRQDGRRAYFKANQDSPIFNDLRKLMEKTGGIVPALASAVKTLGGRIELALVFGSVARGEERAGSDVDLLIVGSVRQIDLLPTLRKLESRFSRECNATIYSRREFRDKLACGDHFLSTVLRGRTVLLKGDPDELQEAVAAGQAARA